MSVNTLKVSTDCKWLTCQSLRNICYQKHVQDSGNLGNVFGNMPEWGRLLRPIGHTEYGTLFILPSLDSPSRITSHDELHSNRISGRLNKRWHFYIYIYIYILIYTELHWPGLRVCVCVFGQQGKSLKSRTGQLSRSKVSTSEEPQSSPSLRSWELGTGTSSVKNNDCMCVCVCTCVRMQSYSTVHWCFSA